MLNSQVKLSTLKRKGPVSIYPPIVLYTTDSMEKIWETDDEINFTNHNEFPGIYIHIPFCPIKCEFCYYTSFSSDNSVIEKYVEYLLKEIQLASEKSRNQARTFHTIYFGGGTPTYLKTKYLEKIICCLLSRFNFSDSPEFCMEIRPGKEFTREKLNLINELGVNRISIGLQSFSQEILNLNGRKHEMKKFYQIYDAVRNTGIRNINIDLMSGMLYETLDNFQDTINEIVRLKPENITCYKLHIYKHSQYYKKIVTGGKLDGLVKDSDEIKMIKSLYHTVYALGYRIYDIAYTYSKEERYTHRHRQYINMGSQFLALGLSANGFINNSVYQNTNNLEEYFQLLLSGILPIKRAYTMDKDTIIKRAIIHGIRRSIIGRRFFSSKYGVDPVDVIKDNLPRLFESDLLEIDGEEIKLKDDAIFYTDDIIRQYILNEKELYMEKLLSDHKNISLFRRKVK